jgi:tetratricopeptide (TPR) repeat protein
MVEWRVLIAVAYREVAPSASGPTWETLSRLAGEGLFHRIRLAGWDQEGVRRYLRGYAGTEPDGDLVRAIHHRTEGNPLFVAEVVRLLDNEKLLGGASEGEGRAWEIHIPEKVRMAILGRVQRLSPRCQEVLSVAALAGREFDATLLQELASEGQASIDQPLEEAIGSGLIEETAGQAGTYRFTHALIQEAVQTQVPASSRAALHFRIGEALERRYGADLDAHAGELAGHFDSAGPVGLDKALRYRQRAGARAVQECGFEDAHEQFSRALAIGEGRASDRQRAELLFGLSKSQHGLGEFKKAVENLGRAFDLFVQVGDLDRAFRVVEQPYLLTERRGLGETRLLERALAVAGPDSPHADRLGFHYGLSLYHDTGDYDAACGIFRGALERARTRGDRGLEKMTLANWAHVENDELHFQKSHEMAERAIRMAEEDQDYWVEATTRYSHYTALIGLGRLQDAEREVRAILRLGERLHSRYLLSAGLHGLAIVMFQKGDLAAADEYSRRVLAMGRSSFNVSGQAVRVVLEYHRGTWRKATTGCKKPSRPG